jgi:hypothetical protein
VAAASEFYSGDGDDYITLGLWALEQYANSAGQGYSWEIVEQVDSVAALKRRDEAAKLLNKSILLNYPFEDR